MRTAPYADKSFRIGAEPEKDHSLDEIKEMFSKGILSTEADRNTWVYIEHLGRVQLKTLSAINKAEKLKELEELMKHVAGEPDAHDNCVNLYHAYLEHPDKINRERLRKAYEAVPEHERCYLGNMDIMDLDYIRILYHPEQKREV